MLETTRPRRIAKGLLALGWLAATLVVPSGFAQATPTSAAPQATDPALVKLLDAADANRDARVSRWELQRFVQRQILLQVEKRVLGLDRNGDGRVTRVEVPGMPATRFARFDLDRDGGFTLWELSRVMRAQALGRCALLFAELDIDGDGMLSRADLDASGDRRVAHASSLEVKPRAPGGTSRESEATEREVR